MPYFAVCAVLVTCAGTAAAQQLPDASTGRAVIGRSDLAGGVHLESHVYGVDGLDVVAGRLLLGVRTQVGERMALGLEATIPWSTPIGHEGDAVIGNLALEADLRLFGDERLGALLGLKLHLPTMGSLEEQSEKLTAGASYAANTYEPGFHLSQFVTLRSDLRLRHRIENVIVAAEAGMDFLFFFGDGHASAMARFEDSIVGDRFGSFHAGLNVGHLSFGGRLFFYGELSLARLVPFQAEIDGKVNAVDPAFHLMTGPGVNLRLRYLEVGLALMVPITRAIQDALDVSVALQLGARW
jgi:hypothetical protein